MIVNIKNFFFIILIFIGFYYFYSEYNKLKDLSLIVTKNQISKTILKVKNEEVKNEEVKNDKTQIKEKSIKKNNEIQLNLFEVKVLERDTFFSILKKHILSDGKIFEIINLVDKYYNLKKLKIDDKILIYKDINEEVKKIVMNIEIDNILIIRNSDNMGFGYANNQGISESNSKFICLNALVIISIIGGPSGFADSIPVTFSNTKNLGLVFSNQSIYDSNK